MSKQTISIILSAIDQGVTAAFNGVAKSVNRGMDAIAAFNKTAHNGVRIMGGLESAVGGLVGAYLGLSGISSITSIMEQAGTAAFTLESSLKAASRQFSDTGSMQQWEDALGRLSAKLQIYSNSELQNAAAKTVDMTKRLGLSREQMEKVLELTGDLSAGRTDLAGGIERVTAALRGEAEASEYLGLTLNENYVKAWHEAHNATGVAWKDLDDMQKAQVRYQVFLEQALPVQGKAAESTMTYAGAIALVKANIANAISGSENVITAMSSLATVLRENSGEIGAMVGTMVEWAAKAVELVVRHQELIITVGQFVAGIYVMVKAFELVGVVTNVVKGLQAAFLTLTSTSLGAWVKGVLGQMKQVELGTLTLKSAFGSLLGLFAAWEIGTIMGNWLNQFDIVQKGGLTMVHVLTMAWLKLKEVWASLPFTGGDASAITREIEASKQAYAELMAEIDNKDKPRPKQKEAPKVQQTTEEADAAIMAANEAAVAKMRKDDEEAAKAKKKPEVDAGAEPTIKKEKAQQDEQAVKDPENWGVTLEQVKSFQANFDAEAGKAINERVDEAWKKIEGGQITGDANIQAALQAVSGTHQVSTAITDAKPSAEKVVWLKFNGGELQGSEQSVEALLQELEAAGLSTA